MTLPKNPKAQASVAQDDALTSVAEDSGLRSISIASLLSNDFKGPLTITEVSNAVGGTVAIKGSNIEFTPTADFNGTASFDYTVSDNGKTDTGSVSFAVTEVNDAPVATDDALTSVAEDSGKRMISFDSPLGNDSAGPANEFGPALTITAVGNAVGGTVAINGSNVEFTPDADFNGPASFDYTLSDGGLIDTGNVSFAITEVNDAPELNIIRDDPTNDTILYGTAGSDIFVFDGSATNLPTYNPIFTKT